VLGAGAARRVDTLSQRSARTMDSNAGVVRSDADLGRIALHARPLDVDAAECLRVLGLERRRECGHASADGGSSLPRCFDGVAELTCERVHGAVRGAAPAMVVGDGVAEDSVEPRDGRLGVVEGLGFLDPFDEGLLEDVLRFRSAPHATLQKIQEFPVVSYELLDDGPGGRADLGIDFGHTPERSADFL